MKAYQQIEAELLPRLRLSSGYREGVAKRVLQLTIYHWPTVLMPAIDSVANQEVRRVLCESTAKIVKEDYQRRYGTSSIWMIFVGIAIQYAIKLLLEWWTRADKRPLILQAHHEMRSAERANF